MLFRSIRTKLTFWYTTLLLVLIVAFALFAYLGVTRELDREINNRLISVANTFREGVASEQSERNGQASAEGAVRETIQEFRFQDYQFFVIDGQGRDIAASADTEIIESRHFDLEFNDFDFGGTQYRVHKSAVKWSDGHFDLLVIYSLAEVGHFSSELKRVLLIGLLCTMFLSWFVGNFLAKKSLAPVSEMGRQASSIGSANLNDRLAVANPDDELGHLARVFNSLLDRLSAAFEQQRQFMADASHELRTPLAVVRAESEVSLARRDRPAGEYIDSLDIVREESVRLSQIVEDLFILARADSRQKQPKFEVVYLDELLADAVRSLRVLAADKDIELSLVVAEETAVSGDESLLHRLFSNLIHNAIKFSPNGSIVTVVVSRTANTAVVKVQDQGPGIAVEDLQNVFKRFFRGDKVRNRDVGNGAGLGLSIAQWIAELHNATIEISCSDSRGTTFDVKFSLQN